MLVLKKTDGKVLKKTVGVSFEKNLGEFSISGVFSGMMMIFSLFSFWALSLFKFNVHFNFHFHCWDLKSLFLLRWQNDAGFESEFQRMAMKSKLQRTNYCRVHYFWWCDDGSVVVEVVDEVTGHRFGSKFQARQCTSKLWNLKFTAVVANFCSALLGFDET